MANNINTISFGPGQSNADLQAQQAELLRRQKIADYLRDQSLQQEGTQVVSGRAIPTSKWGTLAKLFQAGASAYMQKQDEGKQAELGRISAERSAEAIRKLAPPGVFDGTAQQGPQETPPAPMPELNGTPQASTPGQMPPQQAAPTQQAAPSMDPETRQRWVQALATYQVNPELGGKLITELSKTSEFSATPQYDQQGNAFVLNTRGERKMLDGVKARDKLENVNGVWQNPYMQQNGGLAPQDPNQPFQIGADGRPVANMPYQQYQISKSKAGAPSVKTEVKMGESIANQVGPILKESLSAAQGAQGQIDAAERVVKAVNTNNLYTGPMATKRLGIAQLGSVLGIGGANDAEKIANTRQAVRGLAELTLQGRKTMQGQGQITDKESALAEKAISGDIDSMTPQELVIIANASKRAAQHTVQNHQRLVAKTRADQNTSNLADFYDLTPMGDGNAQQQQAAPAPAASPMRRYNPATGRIE